MSAKIRNYFELCKFFMHFFEAVLKQKQQKKSPASVLMIKWRKMTEMVKTNHNLKFC